MKAVPAPAPAIEDDDTEDEDDTEDDTNNTKEQKMTTKDKVKKAKAPKAEAKAKAPKGPVKADKAKAVKAPKAGKAPKAVKAKKDSEAPANRLGEKGSFRYAGKPKARPDGSVELPNGRTIPAPKEITAERVELALARLNGKLGLDFDLAVGMTLTQTRRGADPIKIKITSKGFTVDDAVYASLSSACMAALQRSVSGVEMFDFDKHNNIEVSGKNVPGGSFSKSRAEVAEPAPKAKAKKKGKAIAEPAPKAKAKKKGKAKKAAPEPEEAADDDDAAGEDE
jgi:hypothetical protein